MGGYALKSWTDISNDVKNLLQLNDIALNDIMDDGLIFVTPECRIELSGSPWKPEYWVNDVKCRFSELIPVVMRIESQAEHDSEWPLGIGKLPTT